MNRNDTGEWGGLAILRAFALAMLISVVVIGTASAADVYVNETGWWNAGGAFNANDTPIQAAVTDAEIGDSIFVWNGSYTENVNVNKRLIIEGEGADVVTVTAKSSDDHVFEVTANWVEISGFTVNGATSSGEAGIYIGNVDHCNIHDNIANSNGCGIYLECSDNSMLINNIASDNGNGIYLYASSGNTLTDNTVLNNNNGIHLYGYGSNGNTLTGNTASDNSYGIYLYGSDASVLADNTLTDNTANSNGIGIYLASSNGNTLTDNTANSNTHGIYLTSSRSNTLTNNTALNNNNGIYLYRNDDGNSLVNNTANLNNNNGIYLKSGSSGNTLIGNIASNNGDNGIYLDGSGSVSNTLTDNTASDNGNNGIYLESSSNYNTLNGNTANSNALGICLTSSSSNTAQNNTANSNIRGIYIESSSNYNTLNDNTASSNTEWDIYITSSASTFTNNTLSGTTVSFTYSGDISLKGVDPPAAAPSGWQSIDKFIDVANHGVEAWTFLNFSYSDSDVSDLDESNLTVWKHNGTWYGDCGAQYVDTANNVVGMNITSFSVFAPMAVSPPNITSFVPSSSISDTEGATRTFSVAIDQPANVSWLINGTEVQKNVSVTTASYTNTSAALGVWNVSAIATNTIGIDMQTWVWAVTVDTTPPMLVITSPDASPTSTHSSTVTVTGTASDASGIASVTVNGALASGAVDWSTWSADVALDVGENTIVVVATDNTDNNATKTITITYMPIPPAITSFAPASPVSDTEEATRMFSITADQTVDVTWLINGTIVQDTNTSVTTASYTNTSAALGVWNVSAVASNVNGTDMQTWVWTITSAAARIPGDVTDDGVVNIGDAVLLFNWVSFENERGTTYVLNEPDNANVNGDTTTNIGDATLLFNWVSFPNERGTTYVLQ